MCQTTSVNYGTSHPISQSTRLFFSSKIPSCLLRGSHSRPMFPLSAQDGLDPLLLPNQFTVMESESLQLIVVLVYRLFTISG